MTELLTLLGETARDTVVAVIPIGVLLILFQVYVLRRPVPQVARVLTGFALVVAGMILFLAGLQKALFPLGEIMAGQLTDPEVVGSAVNGVQPGWSDYWLVYVFGACIGFATTIAEPALIAVSLKAQEVSAGTVSAWGLRIVVAIGVSVGIALGCFRIVTGTALPMYIVIGYLVVAFQAFRAPRRMIALAFDSGGVTTSTVTVPLVAALGLGLASTVPGRSPLIDGFGLIAFASLFPMMTVMGYAQIGQWRARRRAAVRAPQTRTAD
jgi:hypothetical protein